MLELTLSVASLVIGPGLQLGVPLVEKCSKSEADRIYNDAARQHADLKSRRDEVAHYFNAEDHAYFDTSVERLTFDLMSLKRTLEQCKGISYWNVKAYPQKLVEFNREAGSFIAEVVLIHEHILERSTQGRDRAKAPSSSVQPTSSALGAGPEGGRVGGGATHAQSSLNDILGGRRQVSLNGVDATCDNETHQQVLEALTKVIEAASVAKSTGRGAHESEALESVAATTTEVNQPLQQMASRQINLRRSAILPNAGRKWYLQAKSASAPALLAPTNAQGIELDLLSGVD